MAVRDGKSNKTVTFAHRSPALRISLRFRKFYLHKKSRAASGSAIGPTRTIRAGSFADVRNLFISVQVIMKKLWNVNLISTKSPESFASDNFFIDLACRDLPYKREATKSAFLIRLSNYRYLVVIKSKPSEYGRRNTLVHLHNNIIRPSPKLDIYHGSICLGALATSTRGSIPILSFILGIPYRIETIVGPFLDD